MAEALRDQMISTIATTLDVPTTYITEFTFQVETTPLSRISCPAIAVIVFCIGIPLLQWFMRDRISPPLKYLILFHNVFLCVASASLAFFMMVTLYSFHESNPNEYGPFRIFCGLNWYDQRGTLTFIYYVNYLLKYYELLDTIFLALKHKKLSFLHCYHHPATLVLTWGQLVDSTGVQWLVILLNLYVHTVMYFYYAMAVLRVKMPWKRLVTIMQILQFILDLIACYGGFILYHTHGKCFGTNRGAIVGCFILTSYLYLFVDFYDETYNKKKNNKKKNEKAIKINDKLKKTN